MRPRPSPVALVAAALLVVTAGCVGSVLGGPPETTVENDADSAYRVVVYTVPVDRPAELEFSQATDDGRRPVDDSEIQFPVGNRNVTLDNERATLQRRTVVDPGGNVTAALGGWDAGETTVYLVETPDERLVYTRIVDCERANQSHSIRIVSNESFESSSTCG